MPYYMRSNDAHDDPRYLMHGLGSTLKSAWGNMKGSWSKPVKYVDKRIINGRMQYLYPEMLEKARRAGQAATNAVKNTAQKAGQTAKSAASTTSKKVQQVNDKAKKAVNDFRNYADNLDRSMDRRQEAIDKAQQQVWNGNGRYVDLRDELKQTTDPIRRAEIEKLMKNNDTVHNNAIRDRDENERKLEREKNEQQSFKYKASRFLDSILDRADDAKDTASGTVKSGADWLKKQMDAGGEWLNKSIADAKKTVNDFRNYSNDVNSRYDRSEEEVRQREARINSNDEQFDKNDAAFAKNDKTYEQAHRDVINLHNQLNEIEKTYGRNSEQYRVMEQDYNDAYKFLENVERESERLGKREDELRDARATNAEALDKAYESMERAEAEKDTFKYKASRFLDNILRGNTEPYTQAGADWLKEQLENGSNWLNGLGEKANSVLDEFREPIEPVTPNIVVGQGNGRTYSGTSQKAERGDVATSQDVERAWEKVQQARRDAGWKQGSNGAYGPSTPEVEAAMEEYLRLREQQSGPVGGARNSSSYGGRPRK